MYFFCTLFDTNYLTRGIALYHSLRQHLGEDFHLFIFPFDQSAYELLELMNLPQVTLVSQAEFESPELLAVKAYRTQGEYCWTCTPSIIAYVLDNYEIEHCTYLDADLFFFDSPALILNHLDTKDVIITEHRYSPQYDQTQTAGRYCVQFVYFNQTDNARGILSQWQQQCIEWCFDRIEDGKFGDQKYLDEWGAYDNVFVPQHLGIGVAPWNVQQYIVKNIRGNPFIYDPKALQSVPLVFYHFHAFKFLDNYRVDLGSYKLNQRVIDAIYQPYWILLKDIEHRLIELGIDLNFHGIKEINKYQNCINLFKRKLKGTYNVKAIAEMGS